MTDAPLAPGTHPGIWQEMVDYLLIFNQKTSWTPESLYLRLSLTLEATLHARAVNHAPLIMCVYL